MFWMKLVGALLRGHGSRRPRHNAPVDPFGDSDRSAAGLTRRFRILRASHLLQTSGPIPSYTELSRAPQSAWFDPADPPKAVLFISHRWKTAHHPDPGGEQAAAIRTLLMNLIIVAKAAASEDERRRSLPSLLVHGVLQAAYILNTAMTFGENSQGGWQQLVEQASARGGGRSLADQVGRGIGIWYDYACLPKGSGRSGMAGADADSRLLVESLRRLHLLISECTLVALRAAGDDYEHRSWCMAELATDPDIERRGCRRIVLRTDLLGGPIHASDLGVGRPADLMQQWREAHLGPIVEWVKTGWQAFQHVERLYSMMLDELEDERLVPLLTTPRPPIIFPGQRALLLHMIEELDRLSRRDKSLLRRVMGQRLQGDVEALVLAELSAANLRCTDPTDLVYTGLMILYARHRGAPELAAFYGACLNRWLSGKPLRLLRYRERREGHQARAWWVFEDEQPAGSPV